MHLIFWAVVAGEPLLGGVGGGIVASLWWRRHLYVAAQAEYDRGWDDAALAISGGLRETGALAFGVSPSQDGSYTAAVRRLGASLNQVWETLPASSGRRPGGDVQGQAAGAIPASVEYHGHGCKLPLDHKGGCDPGLPQARHAAQAPTADARRADAAMARVLAQLAQARMRLGL